MSSVFSGVLIEDYLMQYLVGNDKERNGEELKDERGDETKEEQQYKGD